MLFASFALAPGTLITVETTPLARDKWQTSHLTHRSISERIFLVYCYGGYPGAEMFCYGDDAESRTGQHIAFIGPDSAEIQPFEGRRIVGTFSSGSKFIIEIAANGRSLANSAYVGTGMSGYQGYRCYKDDGRLLWQGLDGLFDQACYSQYYREHVGTLQQVLPGLC